MQRPSAAWNFYLLPVADILEHNVIWRQQQKLPKFLFDVIKYITDNNYLYVTNKMHLMGVLHSAALHKFTSLLYCK